MFEFFYKVIDAFEFTGNVNLLGAMRYALTALGAVVGLAEAWYTAVIADQEGTPCLLVVLCLLAFGHIACVDTFIIMYEDARNVKSVWAGHAIVAVVAVDGGIALDESSRLFFEPFLFLFCEGFEWGVGA